MTADDDVLVWICPECGCAERVEDDDDREHPPNCWRCAAPAPAVFVPLVLHLAVPCHPDDAQLT